MSIDVDMLESDAINAADDTLVGYDLFNVVSVGKDTDTLFSDMLLVDSFAPPAAAIVLIPCFDFTSVVSDLITAVLAIVLPPAEEGGVDAV